MENAEQQEPLFALEELADAVGPKDKTLADVAKRKAINNVDEREPVKLTRQQELNIAKLSYYQHIKGESFDPDYIFKGWPIRGSDELLRKAGKRPTLLQIQRWQKTEKFKSDMLDLGVTVTDEDHPGGLTAEQVVVLEHLTNIHSTKSFQTRIKELGIKPHVYRAWMRQKEFNDAIRIIAGTTLVDSIPLAEAQLATQAAAGDLKAIKFMFEVTGRHDPARQQQVDTQALIGVIIDTVQEIFGSEPEKIREFAEQVKIRSIGVRGVIQQ